MLFFDYLQPIKKCPEKSVRSFTQISRLARQEAARGDAQVGRCFKWFLFLAFRCLSLPENLNH